MNAVLILPQGGSEARLAISLPSLKLITKRQSVKAG